CARGGYCERDAMDYW
nr:immunoglobulin heavy chain junction region [Mus musculus]